MRRPRELPFYVQQEVGWRGPIMASCRDQAAARSGNPFARVLTDAEFRLEFHSPATGGAK